MRIIEDKVGYGGNSPRRGPWETSREPRKVSGDNGHPSADKRGILLVGVVDPVYSQMSGENRCTSTNEAQEDDEK